ncbi:MAG: DUF998 domain-containing protein [Ilumatobacter sp.]|uniref:DUF998 domain-containing protein n=1 Tax=Ilumatobacter sp. TaxID=1967498 RepID=UPI003299D42B
MLRRLAWTGVLGPAAFVGAWALGGIITGRRYSPVHDTISRLAAIGADTRPLMTTGMVVFGIAVPVYGIAIRRALDGPAWISAVTAGLATLGVAAAPLDHSPLVDALHLAAAGVGYVALALVPVLAHSGLVAAGHRRLAMFGAVAALTAGASMITSLVVDQSGLFQRIGLTAGDTFLIASVPAIASLASANGRARLRAGVTSR